MRKLIEISKPAGPRPAGLSAVTSGFSHSGPSSTPTPPQSGATPPPGMSQAEWYNNQKIRKWYSGQLQPPTTAPGEQATEGGKMKRKKKVMEELAIFFIEEGKKKKRAEGGETAKPAPEPIDPAQETAKYIANPKDALEPYKKALEDLPIFNRQQYPKNPPNITNSRSGFTGGTLRGGGVRHESMDLIGAVLQQLQEMGGDIFAKAKKKVSEGVGYAKDSTQSVLQGNRPMNKSDRGIGQTTPLVQSYESSKGKKRAEGGMGTQSGGSYRPSSGKDYPSGPASSLGGNLNKILGGGSGGGQSAPGPSSTDKDLGGDAGGTAGAAAGAVGGAAGEAASAAGAAGAGTGAGGGKEGSTSQVSSGTSIGDTTVVGGQKQPPSGPSKTEGGKNRAYSRRQSRHR